MSTLNKNTVFNNPQKFDYEDRKLQNIVKDDKTQKKGGSTVNTTLKRTDKKIIPEQRVDFNQPKLYMQTRPLSCTINGQSVTPKKQNWSQLLVAIIEHFIMEGNPNISELNHKPMYGNKPFFLLSKPLSGFSQLSNSRWVLVNFNPQIIVIIIKNLCLHCSLDLSNVAITCVPKDSEILSAFEEYPEKPLFSYAVNPILAKEITKILSIHFSNGFRLNSPIEISRFRRFASETKYAIKLSDEELPKAIRTCGTYFEGKVYAVSTYIQNKIAENINSCFKDGTRVVFYSEFYAKNEKWLFEANIVSEKMLMVILSKLFPKLNFTQTYFGIAKGSIPNVLENEILRVWSNDSLLSTYKYLAERLQYIPLERIKYTLGQSSGFIWNSNETFSHISKIEISEEEKNRIINIVKNKCAAHGYISVTDLPFDSILEHNHDLSLSAIQNAIFQICLSDKYNKKGKIVFHKGKTLDALSIMKNYCRTIQKCTLKELLNKEEELTGEIHRWISMEAGNLYLVRIGKDTYVADKHVHFNPTLIDKSIKQYFKKDDYLPLKSFSTFSTFPDCGHQWNLFLLESYCRRFSKTFRFDTPSVNSRNAGVVIERKCKMTYTEIMADAVAKSGISLTETNVGKFLFDSGYTGRSTTAKVGEIINIASIRGR